MKKRIVISIVIILVIGGLYFVHSAATGSGFGIFGRDLGKTVNHDRIVAKVNNKPIYLSDVALPYFSAEESYIKAKKMAKEVVNSSGTPESVKKQYEKILQENPDPVRELNGIIDMKLLCQKIEKRGIKISKARLQNELDNIEKLRKNEHPNEWTKYHNELLKTLGISEKEYLNKYYVIIQKDMDLLSEYSKTIKVPNPTGKEIQAELEMNHMKDNPQSRQFAISNLKSKAVQKIMKEEEDKLRQTADIKIIDINAVKNLSNYFSNQ